MKFYFLYIIIISNSHTVVCVGLNKCYISRYERRNCSHTKISWEYLIFFIIIFIFIKIKQEKTWMISMGNGVNISLFPSTIDIAWS